MEHVLGLLDKKLQVTNTHKKCTEEYSLLKSDEERVIFTLNLLQEHNISTNVKNNDKSMSKSRAFNDEANKLLLSPKSGNEIDLDFVIEMYTKSVAYAPLELQELPLAYANRSAALFKAQLYEDCIMDINRALNLQYPEKWKAKLYARKARCLMALKSDTPDLILKSPDLPVKSSDSSLKPLEKISEAKNSDSSSTKTDKQDQLKASTLVSSSSKKSIKNKKSDLVAESQNSSLSSYDFSLEIEKALEQAQVWLPKMDPTDSGKKIVEKTINDPSKMPVPGKLLQKLPDLRNFPDIPRGNSEIPGASSAIQLKYSNNFGKHVIAARDIRAGEILAVQEAYSSVLVLDKAFTHCWNCLEQVWSGIGCRFCANVIFCSETCRSKAWDEYHDLECKVIGPLIRLEMNHLGIMGLRLVIKAFKETRSLEALKELVTKIDSATDVRTDGFTGNILDDTKYASIYTLAKNTQKRSIPDLFGRSLNAAFIIYFLATNTNMFTKKMKGDLETVKNHKWATFIGGLIMRHQQIIPSNVHSITEEAMLPTPIERAAAMMPFYSLLNHSCNPMVERQSFGNKIALIALVPINKNEQIFDNYGFHFAITPKELRRRRLKQQYYFDCLCEACYENWPLYGHFGSYSDQTLRRDERKKLKNALKKFDEFYNCVKKGDVENKLELMKDLIKMLEILYKNVYLPCIEVNKVLETIKKMYSLRGNRLISIS